METVFITIHDLSLDARIKYCSDSVEDILGYLPHEVKGKSCWEYFHPSEMPFAKAIHGQGLALDKAASFHYCRLKHRDGSWIGCECVFTVVYDVLVASTAIYQRGPRTRRRAVDGASVRRIFSSSPRDPRYHMLSFISRRFVQPVEPYAREPRAALFINRFTRASTIMFATIGVEKILGLRPHQLVGKSFYFCIAETCLEDALRTVESAKGNDSIAYLRFYFRDPTLESRYTSDGDASESDEDDDGGVTLASNAERLSNVAMASPSPRRDEAAAPRTHAGMAAFLHARPAPEHAVATEAGSPRVNGHRPPLSSEERPSQGSSGNSIDTDGTAADAIFDRPSEVTDSSHSSVTPQESRTPPEPVEVEAVVSCTSDGLVVVLRKAHPMVPETVAMAQRARADGIFASPWAERPVMPSDDLRPTTVAPGQAFPPTPDPVESGFMSAIRDVAVFAWSLTGINGAMVDFAHGRPSGEALPPGGLPIWDPTSRPGVNDRYNGFSGGTHRPLDGAGDPAPSPGKEEEVTSSDDEILWKRAPQMPSFRKPKRRAHHDAFGADGEDPDAEDRDGRGSQSRRRKTDNAG